jgi:hypothetical protein
MNRLLKKFFPRRMFKNVQMQVELYEIPLPGALEIMRSEAYLDVRRNDEG